MLGKTFETGRLFLKGLAILPVGSGLFCVFVVPTLLHVQILQSLEHLFSVCPNENVIGFCSCTADVNGVRPDGEVNIADIADTADIAHTTDIADLCRLNTGPHDG